MIAYHGSIHTDLQELRPFKKSGSSIKTPLVYLTTQKANAAFYIWDKPFYWFTYGFSKDGKLEYQEYFKDALKQLYGGKKGAIYTLEGEFESAASTGIKNLVVSSAAIAVKSKEIIEDAYEYILKAERDGEISIIRFENLTENRLAGIAKQVEEIKSDSSTDNEMLQFINQFLT